MTRYTYTFITAVVSWPTVPAAWLFGPWGGAAAAIIAGGVLAWKFR